jgi:NAD(P)-dependent dehydrogenase (short-subunit alcohol dehydrogenase family)
LPTLSYRAGRAKSCVLLKKVPRDRGETSMSQRALMSNVLVTGSSSGFGFVTVAALARRGHTVFATMRDPRGKNRAAADELRRDAEAQLLDIHILDLDVTSDASVQAAIDVALALAGPLDAVVNNAGYSVAGLAETATAQQVLDELNTNVVGMQRVNRAALPLMRARRSGLLVHVSSIFGRTVMPFLGIYVASKWAVEALAECYRYELKPSGVDVTIVQPGAFPTRLVAKRQTGADAARAVGYGPLADGATTLAEGLQQLFSLPDAPDAQEVADAIVALVEAPAGQRPARVVVDRFGGEPVRALNDAHAEVQRGLLTSMGMPFLAE